MFNARYRILYQVWLIPGREEVCWEVTGRYTLYRIESAKNLVDNEVYKNIRDTLGEVRNGVLHRAYTNEI